MTPPPKRCRGDLGQVGGIEALPFGFMIFVAVTLLIANAWGVIDAKLAVTNSAREAVRAYVESDSAPQAELAAFVRAKETLAAYGRDDTRATIDEPILTDSFGRCSRVSITVTYELPTLAVPFIGGLGHIRAVHSTFTEVVDPYRDGLAGTANCR